jgi:hypothetical protein
MGNVMRDIILLEIEKSVFAAPAIQGVIFDQATMPAT